MLGIYIGLLALAESLKPGLQLPKLAALLPAGLSFLIDVLVVVHLLRALIR